MKIALLGYGKMGQTIERIALERGHEIVLKKDEFNTYEGLSNADVAIDFSIPAVAVDNISNCFYANVPVISGTTGWLERYDEMVALCKEKNGAFKFGSYSVEMEEIHHTQKLDAPSGTAISLAKGVIENSDYTNWTLEEAKENQ